jgi:anhydro-N-acetylmuramic acid kinase
LHGHTIFHQPDNGITVQAANLNYIAAKLNLDVVGNFRELDVCRGGQGAPLAPFGEDIFQANAFINFGGIANIGYKNIGYDINFCNLFTNYICQKYFNLPFDKDGEIGASGKSQ